MKEQEREYDKYIQAAGAAARKGAEKMKTKTTLNDLNEYLFQEMDRLTNEDLSAEDLDKEIKRSDALQRIARTVIDNGSLALQAKKHLDEYGQGDKVELPLIGVTVQ